MAIRNRKGKFSVALHYLEDEDDGAMSDMFSRVRIYRCELQYESGSFEYSAISEDFAEVPEGNVIPFYSAIFERQADGTAKFLGFK